MKVFINPKLPANFDSTPHDKRSATHLLWWDRPYIETVTCEQAYG